MSAEMASSSPFQDVEPWGEVLRPGQRSKSVLSLVLFGSRARGDHKEGSDTDLLLITDEAFPRNGSVNTISLSFYPYEHLLSKADHGDLFLCHLVREAKSISDNAGFFERICHRFRFRDSYADDIQKASNLAWFLVRHGSKLKKPELINRRVAWCVRTILIARSAEERNPVFSAASLEAFSNSPLVGSLIGIKGSRTVDASCFPKLEAFLREWGSDDNSFDCNQPIEFLRQFKREKNMVALQTIRDGWAADFGMYA